MLEFWLGIAVSHRLAPQAGRGRDRYLCFTDEEIEIQRGEMTGPRSHRWDRMGQEGILP